MIQNEFYYLNPIKLYLFSREMPESSIPLDLMTEKKFMDWFGTNYEGLHPRKFYLQSLFLKGLARSGNEFPSFISDLLDKIEHKNDKKEFLNEIRFILDQYSKSLKGTWLRHYRASLGICDYETKNQKLFSSSYEHVTELLKGDTYKQLMKSLPVVSLSDNRLNIVFIIETLVNAGILEYEKVTKYGKSKGVKKTEAIRVLSIILGGSYAASTVQQYLDKVSLKKFKEGGTEFDFAYALKNFQNKINIFCDKMLKNEE